MTKIVLGVATCQRPRMLVRCMGSLAGLKVPEGYDLQMVVIDNDCSEDTRRLVEAAALDAVYLAEPQRGVSFVRNAHMRYALQEQADWIVTVDDDQIFPEDWLVQMVCSQEMTSADVVHGFVRLVRPNGTLISDAKPEWQDDRDFTTTNGAMFHRRLIAAEGMALRFDERFAISGGSDRDFFLRAYMQGAKLVETPLAISEETVPDTRNSYRARFRKQFYQAWVEAQQDVSLFGTRTALRRLRRKYGRPFLQGIGSFVVGGLLWPFKRAYAERKLRKSTVQMGRSAGAFWGLSQPDLPKLYQRIDGE